jgi:hypothetical protein
MAPLYHAADVEDHTPRRGGTDNAQGVGVGRRREIVESKEIRFTA